MRDKQDLDALRIGVGQLGDRLHSAEMTDAIRRGAARMAVLCSRSDRVIPMARIEQSLGGLVPRS
jgi:hypothetical protein